MLYLNLIKEDQYNPWLELVKAAMLQSKTSRIMIPLAYQFYLTGNNYQTRKMRQRHQQRVKLQLDFDDEDKTLMQVVQAKVLLN